MRTWLMAAIGIVAIAGQARAEDMVATRPGIMCASPTALADLTLPGGDSKTHRPGASQHDLAEMVQGGCEDLAIGARVTVVQKRTNTSLVTYGGRTLIAPNADFAASTVRCYTDGDKVALTGTLAMRLATGDDAPHGPYHYPVLTLDQPICLSGGNSPAPETRILGLQYISKKLPSGMIGSRATASGELTQPDNGNQIPESIVIFDPTVQKVP